MCGQKLWKMEVEWVGKGGGGGRGGGGVGANLAKCGILYYTSIIILDHSL